MSALHLTYIWRWTLFGFIVLSANACLSKRAALEKIFPGTDSGQRDSDTGPSQPPQRSAHSLELSFNSPDAFGFDEAKLSWFDESFRLQQLPGRFIEDMFIDESVAHWNSHTFQSSFVESLSILNNTLLAETTGTLLGLSHGDMPVLQNSQLSASVTPLSFSGLELVGLITRQSGTRYYLGATYGGRHRLMFFNGTGFVQLAAVATDIPLVHDSLYHLRLEVDGTQLRYKIWLDGEPEPSWLLSAHDSTLTSGRQGLALAGGVTAVSFFEVENFLENSTVPYYALDNPTLELPAFNLASVDENIFYTEIEIDEVLSAGSLLRYELSLDAGLTWLVPKNGHWQMNLSGFADSVTLPELNAYLDSLSSSSKIIKLRAYFHSADGTTSPAIEGARLLYEREME